MGRPVTSGINVVQRKRRDGTVVEYYYQRSNGLFLGHDREVALRKIEAERPPVADKAGTVAWLIKMYLARPEFRMKLAPRTQALYRGYLDEMIDRYGDKSLGSFNVTSIEVIKAKFQQTPRKANQIIALFRILFGYAVKLRLVPINPVLRPEMLPTPPRTQVWSYAEEDAFLAAARPSLRLAMLLMIYTAQRPQDVLAMTRTRITDEGGRLWIWLRQQKTDELIKIPLHARLVSAVRERMESGTLLLVASPTGLPWAYRNFARTWDAQQRAAGVADRQRRDLRRTGVVRMAEAGATVPQIAAVTGWGIDYCQRIVDTYLPRRTEVAAGAIALWEQAGAVQSNVVDMGLSRRRR